MGRDLGACEAVASSLDGLAFSVDATDVDAIDPSLAAVQEHWGAVHAVANCVGSLFLRPLHRTKAEDCRALDAI